MRVKSCCVYFSVFGALGLLISGTLSAKGKGNCELIDENNRTLSPFQWERGIDLEPIDDISKTDILRHYRVKNLEDVDVTYNNDQANKYYIDFDAIRLDEENGDDYVIIIRQGFKYYEDRETSTVLKLRSNLFCTNDETSEIEFRIPIRDTNNHDPEFLQESYEFTLPMPIPKGYNVDFSGKIIARDVDLTNERITLSFENENLNEKFLISSRGQDQRDKKNYLTNLITATTIDLEDDLTFTLVATDSGKPPRTSNTTVNIIVDKKNSYPRFAHPLYTADLAKTVYLYGDNIPLQFSEGNVTVTRGYQDIDSIEIRETSDENKKHFTLSFSGIMSESGLITYVALNNLTEEFLKQKVISVVLVAVRNHIETTTVLQILLPEVPVIEPPCEKNEKAIILQDDSTNGFMVATIILSLVSVGLTGFIIFLFLNKRTNLAHF